MEMIEFLPDNYRPTHYWIMLENKICIKSIKDMTEECETCHADIWGEEAWDIDMRGTFEEKTGVLSCYAYLPISRDIIRKIVRKFEREGLIVFKFRGKEAIPMETANV